LPLLLITGLIAGTTSALRTSDEGRTRTLAIHYAQEALELTRKLRDTDWVLFQGRSGLWCLDKAGSWTQGGTLCPVNIDTIYTRGVTFAWNSASQRMEVTATVSWQDGEVTRQTELTTYFTQWQ